MQRTRDWRRAQTRRVINRRLDIIKHVWYNSNPSEWRHFGPHKLSKWNLTCNCRTCKMNRHDKPDEDVREELDIELDSWYDEEEGTEYDPLFSNWNNPCYRYTDEDIEWLEEVSCDSSDYFQYYAYPPFIDWGWIDTDRLPRFDDESNTRLAS